MTKDEGSYDSNSNFKKIKLKVMQTVVPNTPLLNKLYPNFEYISPKNTPQSTSGET
jgi:hypothetical protein